MKPLTNEKERRETEEKREGEKQEEEEGGGRGVWRGWCKRNAHLQEEE